MKTEELIAALSADPVPAASAHERMARWILPGILIPFAALVLLWSMRPDIAAALASPVVAKTLVPLVLSGLGLWLALVLSRPVGRANTPRILLALSAVLLLANLVYQFARVGWGGFLTAIDTPNTVICLISVPVLAAIPLGVALWSMRAGAPSDASRAGAAAGLFAGTIAAAIYSLHCPVDNALFCLTIYSVPILVVTGLGMMLGRRLLRW